MLLKAFEEAYTRREDYFYEKLYWYDKNTFW